jgi:hypothetical protein
VDLVSVALGTVYAVVKGHKANGYFGDIAFHHPGIAQKPSVSHVTSANGEKTVHFIDGTCVTDVDEILFGTGYSWTLPFIPSVEVRNNRVPELYLHVVYQRDPTLLFVGGVRFLTCCVLCASANSGVGCCGLHLPHIRMASRPRCEGASWTCEAAATE